MQISGRQLEFDEFRFRWWNSNLEVDEIIRAMRTLDSDNFTNEITALIRQYESLGV